MERNLKNTKETVIIKKPFYQEEFRDIGVERGWGLMMVANIIEYFIEASGL